jgi:hypothetical protein
MCSAKKRSYAESSAYCEALWMHVASVHSQAEHDAIGQLMGPTGQWAFLGAERLDDMTWRWHDGTPWDFEAWDVGEPSNTADAKSLVIKWQPGVGVVWSDVQQAHGVICEAASISAIRGNIIRLGGPKNVAIIAASEEL